MIDLLSDTYKSSEILIIDVLATIIFYKQNFSEFQFSSQELKSSSK